MATLTTRIFKNGNGQAVRIPQELRIDATLVEISRNENGDLIIHPIPVDRGAALLAALNAFDDDFVNQLWQDKPSSTPCRIGKPYEVYAGYQYPHLSDQKQTTISCCLY